MPCSQRHSQYIVEMRSVLGVWTPYFRREDFQIKYRELLDEAAETFGGRFHEYADVLQKRLDGMTPENIAEEYGVTTTVVRERHDRGIKALRFYVKSNPEKFS